MEADINRCMAEAFSRMEQEEIDRLMKPDFLELRAEKRDLLQRVLDYQGIWMWDADSLMPLRFVFKKREFTIAG